MTESIHQTISQTIQLPAPPREVYDALMDSQKHSDFTGGPAEISEAEGGEFSCHGGQIEGRNIQLKPAARIVQAWRVAGWPEGSFTLLTIDLTPAERGTQLALSQAGVPEEMVEHLAGGWHKRYWEPLREFLGKTQA